MDRDPVDERDRGGHARKHTERKRDRRIETVDRQVRALQLRKTGLSYAAIAQTLGYSNRSGPHKAVSKALAATVRESADALRSLELERIDRLQVACWGPATANPPNYEAIRTIIRLMQRRAKLLGLDAPTETRTEVLFRSMAEQIAKEEGIDVDQLIAEAERVLAAARHGA